MRKYYPKQKKNLFILFLCARDSNIRSISEQSITQHTECPFVCAIDIETEITK